MALKGAISKQNVTQKILDTFEGSFTYEQEIRIPLIEDGVPIQLKCVLTCAKVNVEPNGENAIPGEVIINSTSTDTPEKEVHTEATQEEKDNVRKLMQMLNL